MSHPPVTSGFGSETGRYPFGELHRLAVSRCPATITNAQREDFLRERPNVWGTLRRHLVSLIESGATQEQYDAVIHTFVAGALDLWDKRHEPHETLAEACALDEAAEGVEDVAEIDAVANPTPGRLQSLYVRMSASFSMKRRALRVIQRDLRRAVAR